MKKITLATVKSFVKKNESKLLVQVKSSFNGMIDGCDDSRNCDFTQVTEIRWPRPGYTSSMSIDGNSLLGSGGSGNLFKVYEDDNFIGFDIYNCCGWFIIATQKVA